MFDYDPRPEKDLQLLKKAITPSPDLGRRIHAVTQTQARRYSGYPMALSKFLTLAAALMVVAIAILGFRNRGPVTTPSETSITSEQVSTGAQQGSRVSSNNIDNIINSLLNDAVAEQSIADESDTDVALMDSDRAAIDSFAATYHANEY